AQATFAQKRTLVELLIDRVLVDNGDVEIRYVITTTPRRETTRFYQLRKDDFEMPLVPWLGAATLQLIGVVLPKFQTPLADGLGRHVDAALEQEFLHVAVAQRAAIIQPDAMANDLPREAVVLVAFGVSGWRHVWLPIGVCEWFL